MPDEIDPATRSDSGYRTDPDEELPSELDHATDRKVRRLLADARHDSPLPTAVALRLDEVLAGLVAEAAVEAEPAVPIDLDARRRRKHWTTGLVAAAAVVVAGVSVPALLDASGGDGAESASTTAADNGSADSAAESDDATSSRAGQDKAGAGGSRAQEAPREFTASGAPAPGPVLEVSPDEFRSDALTARVGPAYDALARPALCGPGPVAAAVEKAAGVVLVRYDDQKGYLVFLEPQDETQQVDLYLCPTGDLERTTRIPAP